MSTKTKIGIGAGVIIFLIVLLTEGVLIPKQLQPDVLPLRFKRYANDSTLRAEFEMHNRSGSAVVVWEAAELITQRETKQEVQEIAIQRTMIAEEESELLVVAAPPTNCAWQVRFRVSRFGPRERRRFESAEPLNGTIVYSDFVPEYESSR